MDKKDGETMRKKEKLYNNIKSALLVSLIILSSYFYLPLPSVSGLSLQTVFINLAALLLPPVQGLFTVGLWLLMGAVGIPVFSGGGGIGKLFGVTGGFYWGFLAAVPLMSKLKGKEVDLKRYLLSLIAGLLTEHVFAVAFMCFHNGGNVFSAVASISLPFIVGDILKCFLSAFAAVKINKVIYK
ncbi:MAG: biotin transporter BioY [Clostridia bacterium]|nr:biotin transporter BioY [Clostridia bacterium]